MLRAGDWVEVRSKEEILATLDGAGRLDAMPFMPEMFAYCGRRLRIGAVAHKSCDTVNWTGNRRLKNSVHLEGARCSGAAHGGCKAGCLLFWKTAWLKPAERDAPAPAVSGGCTEEDVARAAHAPVAGRDLTPRFRCQATEHPAFTSKLRNLDPRQYARDFAFGNVGVGAMLRTVSYFAFDLIGRPANKGNGAARALYDWWAALVGLVPYPRKPGTAPNGAPEPIAALNLGPGDLVRVKSYDEICKTLDKNGRNRGMLFDAELVPYCGGVFRVRSRVDVFIEEKSGKLRTLKTPAVILENVWCRSHYSDRRLFCPRAIYSWWREAWLERAPEGAEPSAEGCLGARAILRELV